MMGIISDLTLFLTVHYWIIAVMVIMTLTSVMAFIERRLYHRLWPALKQTQRLWDDPLIEAVHRPLSLLIWTIGLSVSLSVITSQIDPTLFQNAIERIRNIVIVGLLLWFFIRLISNMESTLLDEERRQKTVDKTTITAGAQILRIISFVIAGLIALQSNNIQIAGLLAFGGIGTLTIGLAAKDWLSNFFGGFMIYLDRPFAVGDWIRSPDKDIEGYVEQIGWRLTRIRTLDRRPLYVPNGVFSNIAIENPSRMLNRRIDSEISLRYEDAKKIPAILAAIEKMIREHPGIDTDQLILVNLVEFKDSGLIILIYAFTKATERAEYLAVQQEIFLEIIDIIDRHGAKCAFPTTTLNVPHGTSLQSHRHSETELS
jgi:MscS family membrane protein